MEPWPCRGRVVRLPYGITQCQHIVDDLRAEWSPLGRRQVPSETDGGLRLSDGPEGYEHRREQVIKLVSYGSGKFFVAVSERRHPDIKV